MLSAFIRVLPAAFALMLATPVELLGANSSSRDGCVPVGTWIHPGSGERRDDALVTLAKRAVVLLGESHDEAEHHRWQLHTIAALISHWPDMVLGFEMC